MNAPAWFENIDRLIRRGAFSAARAALDLWKEGSPTRKDWVFAAEAYRRLGMPEFAIRLLMPVVRPIARRAPSAAATDSERAEYAGALIRIGATAEARRHLLNVDPARAPMRPLFEGLAAIHEWDFTAAIDPLSLAYRSLGLSDYARLIAGVNLGQSYLHSGRHAEARELIAQLIERTRTDDLPFLRLNLESLAATNEIMDFEWGDLGMADVHLGRASTLGAAMSSEGSYDELVLRKAIAMIPARREGNVRMLGEVRSQALRFDQPEIARDCDLQIALTLRDTELLNRVYYRTPFPAYQARIERLAAHHDMEVSEMWTDAGNSRDEARVEYETWDFSLDRDLKPGQALFRLFNLLFGEGYRSFTITNLVTEVFPDAYFNFTTSPDQIHQLLKRARRFLKTSQRRVEIEESRQRYQIRKHGNFPLVYRKWRREESAVAFRLRHRFGEARFTAADAQVALGISQSVVSRQLQEEISRGKVERIGKGKKTQYILCEQRIL